MMACNLGNRLRNCIAVAWFVCCLVLMDSAFVVAGESRVEQTDVFVSGREGYHTYRIPAMVITKRGTILAFCEGRKTGRGDHGDVDLILRRGTDGGRSWSATQLVYEEGETAKITIGNPCPVVDRETGVIWLPFCRDNRDVFVTKSRDDGVSWAEPVRITSDVTEPQWRWVATGPGHGIQLQDGRLLIPCDHSPRAKGDPRRGPEAHSHMFYSDDHGRSWQLGGMTRGAMHECQVVQRADGSLLLSMRNYVGLERRAFASSVDGGLNWTEPEHRSEVYCPVCQAGLLGCGGDPNRSEELIIYSGPGGPGRTRMTIRLSDDGGRTWPIARILHQGPSAYSDLVLLPGGEIGCLYERGGDHPYERLTFARFTRAWLRGDGRRQPGFPSPSGSPR